MSFLFFSGFGFSGEAKLFDRLLPDNKDFVLAGFSMGAIDAFLYLANCQQRVDDLILISPAFYQENDEKFKNFQLNNYIKDSQKYQNSVYKACQAKSDIENYKTATTKEQLEKLLFFVWDLEKLTNIINNGTKITVFLGEKDRVIDSKKALDFFSQVTTVYFYKNCNHLMEEL